MNACGIKNKEAGMVTIICKVCRTPKRVSPSHYTRKYCSRECYNSDRIGKYKGTNSKHWRDPEKRFENNIERIPECGCWIWMGHTESNGYGRISIGKKIILAHRFAYELYIGKIPDGLDACHDCDTSECCNPYHLFLGTNLDNMIDAAKKGRFPRKINPRDVLKIRSDPRSSRTIAKEYGISASQIIRIKSGERWSWL